MEVLGIAISLLGIIIKAVDQIFHVEYPQISMRDMDGVLIINQPYTFSLVNIGDAVSIVKVDDKNNVLNPNAYDFKQLPVEWSKDAYKRFTLRNELRSIPDDLDIILYLQDVRHRYFSLRIRREEGIIKTDVYRTLKCSIIHKK